jgi:hypothetical protein
MREPRFVAALVLAAIAGVAIGLVDSSPGWDDTGITVASLFLAAGITAAISRRRPWLFALLVGGWVPVLELPRGGGSAPLFALLFSGVGAGVGYMLARTLASEA